MSDESKSGLLAGGRPIPLEGVRVEARLVTAHVEVTVTQRYRNREPVPVEAVYVFPLDEAAAVCGFAALASGKLIRGQVEERERAFEKYDDALLKGDGGFLLDQERPNVFTASVANLRPGEEVEIQIRYVVEERAPGERTQSNAELRRIPVALTTGWGDLSAPGSAPARRTRTAGSERKNGVARPERRRATRACLLQEATNIIGRSRKRSAAAAKRGCTRWSQRLT